MSNNTPSKEITLNIIYAGNKKLPAPIAVRAIIEPERAPMFDNCGVKQMPEGTNFFFQTHASGAPVKNENGNTGVGFSRMLTGVKGRKPLNGNIFDLRHSNWLAE